MAEEPDESEQYNAQLPIDKLVRDGYQYVVFILSTYGWHVVLALVVAAIVVTNLKPSIQRWLKKRENMKAEANFDPIQAEKFQDGMLRAYERMQKKQDEKALENQNMENKKKTEERDNRIQQWEDFKLVSKSRSSKPKVKPDQGRYFPLGGGGLGENYRPQSRARGAAGGGG